jgi:hypothetical protein
MSAKREKASLPTDFENCAAAHVLRAGRPPFQKQTCVLVASTFWTMPKRNGYECVNAEMLPRLD